MCAYVCKKRRRLSYIGVNLGVVIKYNRILLNLFDVRFDLDMLAAYAKKNFLVCGWVGPLQREVLFKTYPGRGDELICCETLSGEEGYRSERTCPEQPR